MSSKFAYAYSQLLKCRLIRHNIRVNEIPGQRRAYAFGWKRPPMASQSGLPDSRSTKSTIECDSPKEENGISRDTQPPSRKADMQRKVAAKTKKKKSREPLPPIVVPKPNKVYITPNIVIFHNPESASSLKALSVLEDAQIAYPNTKRQVGPPLILNVKVERRLPTVEEIQDARVLKGELNWTDFLSEHASTLWRLHPTSARTVIESVERQQKAFIERPDTIPHPICAQPDKQESEAESNDGDDDKSGPLSSSNVPPVDKLDIDDPLFGTSTIFAWPMIIWNGKETIIGPGLKRLRRLLTKTKHVRDGSMDPKEHAEAVKQIKSELIKARWAKTDRKEVSVSEDAALEWFKETDNNRKNQRQ